MNKLRWVTGFASLMLLVGLLSNGANIAQDTEAQARGGLAKLLPADTAFFVSLKDVTKLQEKFADSPYATLLDHEGYRQFITLIEKEFRKNLKKFKREWGFKLEDFLKTFDGEVAFAWSQLDAYLDKAIKLLEKEGAKKRNKPDVFRQIGLPDLILLAETKTKSQEAKKYMTLMFEKVRDEDEGFTFSTLEDFGGHKGIEVVKFGDKKGQLFYAQLKGLFVITATEEAMKQMIENKMKPPADSLASRKEFQKVTDKVGAEADFLLYADVKPWIKVINKAIDVAMAESPLPSEELGGVVKKLVDDVIGLKNLASFGIAGNLGSTGSSLNLYIGTKGRPKGIFRLIAGKKGDLTPPSYVPKNATTFGIARMNIGPFWEDLEAFIREAAKLTQQQKGDPAEDPFKALELMLGFSIKDNLIDQIGETWVTFTLPKEEGDLNIPTFYVIDIKDEEEIEGVIEKILQNPFLQRLSPDEDEYKGKKIYTFGRQFSLTVSNEKLICATTSADGVKKVLKKMQKKKGESLEDNADYEELKGKISKEATSTSYMSATYFHDLIAYLKEMSELFGTKDLPEGVNLEKLPNREVYQKLFVGTIQSVIPEKEGLLIKVFTQYRK